MSMRSCTKTNPQCSGRIIHGECYGAPACAFATFDTVPRKNKTRRELVAFYPDR